MPLLIDKSALALDPCSFQLTLSAEGSAGLTGLPLYLVFVVDATASMGTMDMNNNTATRFQVADQAIQQFLNVIFSSEYAAIEKHIALVTFGNGARVHVTKADGQGKFSSLVNPSPSTIPAGGIGVVEDYYIGANSYSPVQAQTALLNFQSVLDKTPFFYQNEADVIQMVNNISRYSNTNAQSGLLLATELLQGITENAHKVIIFITDGESAASSNFFTYYNETDIPTRINAATLFQQGGLLFAAYNGILAPVTDEDLIREGIDPSSYDPATFTPLQVVSLKLRALARSAEFFEAATAGLIINPFAGEWHNFDGRNADNITRVPSTPNLLNPITLNGYYWSNGLIGFTANYFYYEQSPFFAKVGGIWQFSQSPTGIPLQPVYVDAFFPQSIEGQTLNTVTFDNSDAELSIFATDQKIPQTRMIDYYEQTSRNIYASNEAKKFMIEAANTAQAAGIIIDTIGIGSAIRLPEYLDQTASSGQAYIVPRDIDDAQNALRDQMLEFTREVYTLTQNILIVDAIPRRNDPSLPINDGTFQLDIASIQVAFVHTPGDPILFQPVTSSSVVNVSLEVDRYVITFQVGDLWSPEEASLQADRNYKAIITFRIIPNNGVMSSNVNGVPDIPTNLDAFVRWTEAEAERFQPYPPAYVFVLSSCSESPLPTPLPNNVQEECIRVTKVYDWVVLSTHYRNKIAIPDECLALVSDAILAGQKIAFSCIEPLDPSLACRIVNLRRESILVNGTTVRVGVVRFLCSSFERIQVFADETPLCAFTTTVQFDQEVVLCLPEPLDAEHIVSRIYAIACTPTGTVLLGGMVQLDIALCLEIRVEAQVQLEILAKFCSPRPANIPVPSPTISFRCPPILQAPQCPLIFPRSQTANT